MAVEARSVEAFTRMVRESGPTLAPAISAIVLAFAASMRPGDELTFVVNSAGKTGVHWKKNDLQWHSFIVNKADLLFYLNAETVGKIPDPQSLKMEVRTKNERTCRIHNLQDANLLLEELKLPVF